MAVLFYSPPWRAVLHNSGSLNSQAATNTLACKAVYAVERQRQCRDHHSAGPHTSQFTSRKPIVVTIQNHNVEGGNDRRTDNCRHKERFGNLSLYGTKQIGSWCPPNAGGRHRLGRW